jgi:UDP-2-acetamido-3-amino-2,3-dideoxy-glucuronate N-acetyltransferase
VSVHPLAEVETGARLGARVSVWRWSLIRGTVTLGDAVKVGSGAVVGPDVAVGARSKIEDGAKIYGPAVLGEFVFIGPNAVVTNDRHPRADQYHWRPDGPSTLIEDGASVGAGAVIMPGVRIGAGAMIGAGAVVTRDVPAGETWAGCPAERRG